MKTGFNELVNRILENDQIMAQGCVHLQDIKEVTPHTTAGCEECLKIGARWVHLRLCLACGHVGCCDDSRNKHARQHFQETGHSMVVSYEPGETWLYCFADDRMYFIRKPS